MVIVDGLAVMLKVGGGGGMIVKTTLTLCARLPLAPDTVAVAPLPPPPKELTVIESKALAVAPGVSVTLVGLTDQVLQAGGHVMRRQQFVLRETVPANPLMLVMLMIDVAVVPARIASELGFADIVKSGDGVLVKLASKMFSGSITPALTTVTHVLPLLVPVQPVGKSMKVPGVLPTIL
jgi:hypothetical protein